MLSHQKFACSVFSLSASVHTSGRGQRSPLTPPPLAAFQMEEGGSRCGGALSSALFDHRKPENHRHKLASAQWLRQTFTCPGNKRTQKGFDLQGLIPPLPDEEGAGGDAPRLLCPHLLRPHLRPPVFSALRYLISAACIRG